MNTAINRDRRQPDQIALRTENSATSSTSAAWTNPTNQTNGLNRSNLLFGGFALLLLLALAVGYAIYQHRTAEAQTAFGEAMQTYQTPLVRPDQTLPPGMKAFNTAKERATEANVQFVRVAGQFGLTEPGKLAQYFAGLTYREAGQMGPAESTLQTVSKGWNGDTAALGKLALAQLYSETGRNEQAVMLYQELAKGHATTVPPSLAQLQLAALYTAEGRSGDARNLYAQLKDHDKDAKGQLGVAAQVASEKLNPQAAPPAALGPR